MRPENTNRAQQGEPQGVRSTPPGCDPQPAQVQVQVASVAFHRGCGSTEEHVDVAAHGPKHRGCKPLRERIGVDFVDLFGVGAERPTAHWALIVWLA